MLKQWLSLQGCTFLFSHFGDFLVVSLVILTAPSQGFRLTRALGTSLCRVPSGSHYIYGLHVLKFIRRLSCYLADLLFQPTLTCQRHIPTRYRQQGLSLLWYIKERRNKRAVFPQKTWVLMGILKPLMNCDSFIKCWLTLILHVKAGGTIQPNLTLDFFLRLGKTRKSVPENKDEIKGANSISEEDSVFSNFFLLCRRLLFCV